MSKQEKKRLERLKKELDNQQKKLDEDKKKFHAQKKAQKEEKAKLQRERKQLDQKIRKFQLENNKLSTSRGGRPTTPRSSGVRDGELAKTKSDLKETRDKLDKEKKTVRELRKSVNDKEARIKALERQLKKAGKGKKEVGNDKVVKQLKREIANLRKRLKLALRDLDKQARYYQQQLRRFKQDQQKWITRQRDVAKKGIVVKYVFIDDIRKIKVYKKGKRRIKIRTRDGGEVIVRDVQIVEASEVEEAADDVIDEVTQELEEEFKKTRRKKKKRKKTGAEDGDDDDDDEDASDEDLDDEDDEPQNLDDIKDEDLPDDKFEDHTDDIYSELLQELSLRTKDLSRINEIYNGDEADDVQDGQFKELWESVVSRHEKWNTKLTDELQFDLADELPELGKNWQDEIYKVKDSVVIIRRRARKKGKAEGLEEAKAAADYATASEADEQKQQNFNEQQYLIAAKEQLITELNGRISDLTQLNAIYFHPEENSSILSKDQQVAELVNHVESRHEAIINELSELPPSANAVDELLPENNDQWKALIYSTGKDLKDNDAEPLREELELRTSELDTLRQVVSGEEPVSALEALVGKIQQRTAAHAEENFESETSAVQEAEQKDRAEWLRIMEALQKANGDLQNQLEDAQAEADAANAAAAAAAKSKDTEKVVDMSPTAKAQKMVIEGLLAEMDNRRRDLDTLSRLNNAAAQESGDDAAKEAEKIRSEAARRHKEQNEKMAQDVRALAAAAKQAGGEGDKDIQDALALLNADNAKWASQLDKLGEDSKNVELLKKRNVVAMEELDGRIADVLKMKDLYDKATENKTGSKAEAESQFDSLRQAVKDRHEGIEQKLTEQGDAQLVKEMEENHEDWRDALWNTASHVAGIVDASPLSPEPATPAVDYAEAKEEEPTFDTVKAPRVAIYDDEQKEWWLDKDARRREHIDSINVDDEQTEKIIAVGAYCDRVLYKPNADDMGVATDLYFPIPEPDTHHILSTFYDGTMLCGLLHKIDPDYVDKRVINYPDPFDPVPLSDRKVLENVSLLLSAARAIGVEMTSYDVEDWMGKDLHTQMLLELVDGLSGLLLTRRLCVAKQPELCRLIKDGEDPLAVEHITGEEWLTRWMNNTAGKGLGDEIDASEWNGRQYNTMQSVSPIFKNSAPVGSYSDDANKAAMAMVTHLTNQSDTGTTVRPSDMNRDNFGAVHKYFSAEVYSTKSGLAPLSDAEREKYKKYLTPHKATSEDTFISWINALMPAHLHIDVLARDLSDGVVLLKLLEKGKAGCVNWKKAREKVKHKFDKLNNCNMVMGIARKAPFNLSLVGMGGNDIVDGHQQFLSSLLWQLMRFMATKQISELSFGGKNVTDGDMLQWANLTIVRYEEKQSKPLTNFKDRTLSTCIFYIELLAAVRPDDVDTSLIDYSVRPLVNNRVDDKSEKERIGNARLAMSYLRKFGADLFVLPEHLCAMDSKAVLSMFAGIMTVGMRDTAYSGDGGDKAVNDAMMGYK